MKAMYLGLVIMLSVGVIGCVSEGNSNSPTGGGTDSNVEEGTEIDTETASGIDTETASEIDTTTESGIDTETESEIDTETESDSDSEGPPLGDCVVFVDGGGDDDNDGSDWDNAVATINRGVIIAAPMGCEVWVAQGTYAENVVLLDDVALYGGFVGDETDREQRSWTDNITVIDGMASGTVVTCDSGDGCGDNVVVDGFSIVNGYGDNGGGMYTDGDIVVSNCIFEDNAAEWGGGMYNYASAPEIVNCVFRNNSGDTGGGVLNSQATPKINNCTFISNTSETEGGAMTNSFCPTTVVIRDSVFAENSAGYLGGGVFSLNSKVEIVNVTFADNHAEYSGGALENFSYPGDESEFTEVTISNAIFWGNVAGTSAEAISEDDESYHTISYSDIEGGHAGDGNIDADPLFVNTDEGDYHLLEGSPCIDKGYDPDASELDMDGTQRADAPSSPNCDDETSPECAWISDMGAFEFVSQ